MTRGLLVLASLALAACLLPPPARASRPLQTALMDPYAFAGPEADLAFKRARAAGVRIVRLGLHWRQVAPHARPSGFDPENPADPAYRWDEIDRRVTLAVANGLSPILVINAAPVWAQNAYDNDRGWPDWRVDAAEVGRFARAAARRYSGGFAGLPRVRYWQAWNEPNLSLFLNPQYGFASSAASPRPFDTNVLVSPTLYREIVNEFSRAVKAVHANNVVIAGGLGPFTGFRPFNNSMGPLRFMRALLCVSAGSRPRPTCRTRVEFDIWATHPYTSGGPTHHAIHPDDVSLGDLPEMRRVLSTAVRAGNIVSNRRVQFWVTEFGWDSKPPDAYGVPARLHARWVSEALYRMWQSRVTLVTWFLLRDEANNGRADGHTVQSGLYLRGGESIAMDRAKLSLRAFRFPFVAFAERRKVFVWGRTPTAKSARVVVQQRRSGRWRRVAVRRANRHGIFSLRVAGRGRGPLRARANRMTSVPFSLKRPPDRNVNPFGGPLETGPERA